MFPASTSKTALITGATSGIGYELAKLFAQNGTNLVLVARNQGRLAEIKADFEQRYHVQVTSLPADLSVPGQAALVHEQCQAKGIRLDYLINNAGVGYYGKVAVEPAATNESMLNLNVVSLTMLTALVVRDMVARGAGRILNVGSTSAFQPVPNMAVYGASKSYVMHFTEALHAELKGTGVTATVLSPGVTETNFLEQAKMGKATIAQGHRLTSAEVARAGYDALLGGKLNVITGWKNKLLALGISLVPSRRLALAMSSLMMGESS